MNFRLYKPGQGYWMRVITAAFFGTLILACAAWLWREAEAVRLPTKGYTVPVFAIPEGRIPAAGDSMQFLTERVEATGDRLITLASTTIAQAEITSSGATIITNRVTAEPDQDPLIASQFRITPAAPGQEPYNVTAYASVQQIPIFDQQYLQVGAASVVILIGAAILFYMISVNPRTGEFLIATDGEMKKVNWSTRKEIIGSTWVVVTTVFVLAAILFVVDNGFATFFRLIGVLDL
jgi:preprotein translocase SecE subunit